MQPLLNLIQDQLRTLMTHTYFHAGTRVLCAISFTLLPALLWQQTELSLTLALGVVACGIAETDDASVNRLKSLSITLVCFLIASFSVELLYATPTLFVIGLASSTFIFIMLGIFGQRYGQIAFGALIIAIYTMIGYQSDHPFYIQPLMLTAGALWYGLFSLMWAFASPYRSLHEQLAQLYFNLSRYQLEKSRFFGSNQTDWLAVRQNLVVQNINVVNSLNICKDTLNNRLHDSGKKERLDLLLQYYLIAQQIHERVTATHYQYSQLESAFSETQMTQGFHQLISQLSEASHQLGKCILMRKSYTVPASLSWTVKALQDQLEHLNNKHHFDTSLFTPLSFVLKNLTGIHKLLLEASEISHTGSRLLDDAKLSTEPKIATWDRITHHIKSRSAIFRHAIRMSLCFVTGYLLLQYLDLEKGYWVLLTCLFVCQPSFSETRKRLIQRVIGTFIGVAIGFPLLYLLPGVYGQFFVLALSAFFFFTYLKTNYSIAVIFITVFVMMVFNLLSGTGLEVVWPRIQETVLGSVLAVLTVSFILPQWQYKRIPNLLSLSLHANLNYFEHVVEQYHDGKQESLPYRIARRDAHIADINLASAWQNMLIDPGSKRKLVKESYALTNRNNALLAYISALAAHRAPFSELETRPDLAPILALTRQALNKAIQSIETPDCGHTEIEAQLPPLKITELTPEQLSIVQQLQLIANTATDIQALACNITNVK
ncbi:TIGR01666 family membrane protein [Motilimonas cestriensis]|uniref:TIGR01666 family membrane protein n=1 Tax=Motilimonas cestriensis TaxID=2742685 RepID=A0ABS8WAX1_9GAMM|nr:YccS family putative transporter [Motilimonas cestriensis]MCE2595663.1 TIGR01666 family membrane protein [Motilimonas cestriensis]